MSDYYNQQFLYKIAQSYFEDNLTQLEISKKFSISRMKVGRLLKQAKKQKLVQIIINEPKDSKNIEIERFIEKKYKLDEVIITTAFQNNYPQTLRRIAENTAIYLNRILQGDEIIGLSWGYTVSAVVDSLPKKNWPSMEIVQLMGGLGSPEAEVYGANLIVKAAQTLGAKERLISSPGILPNIDVCDALKKDPQIAETLRLGSKSSIAIVGIGSPSRQLPAIKAGILNIDEMKELEKLGAVGDICLRFVNKEGTPIISEINKRIISINLESLKKIPRVIGVATGIDKLDIVKAVLIGKYINVLITDSILGIKLVEEP